MVRIISGCFHEVLTLTGLRDIVDISLSDQLVVSVEVAVPASLDEVLVGVDGDHGHDQVRSLLWKRMKK